ncbi:MAG: hypothetical protein HN509_08785 [Halobacteriovoraceae bacterium]|nr:hypothetical protein [Halobacteriovoraceae bacterium]MBT5095333.1 hypothetical protein [Halobacteriovoraceae bacterium]
MKISNSPLKNLKNESGVALLMVISSIAILSFLLADFSFETSLNKIRVYNIQDRLRAKINAEAGIRFALAKLRLYQEGRNLIAKNESLKGTVNPSDIEAIITQPFIFPIPEPKGLDVLQRTAIADFKKAMILEGEIAVTITPVSGFLNPNTLRVFKTEEDEEEEEPDDDDPDSAAKKTPQQYIEGKLLETLKSAFTDKMESSEDFQSQYGSVEPELLIQELKYYVSDKSALNNADLSEAESQFNLKEIVAKHAPMTSLDELYLLPSWDDELVDLIKNQLTVHQTAIIQVNEITKNQLKILFPKITEIQIEEFFRHRDGDEELEQKAKKFKNTKEFEDYIVSSLGVVDADTYKERVKEFAKAGLRIGAAGKLYKVVSSGTYERASYNLVAYIDLPIKPSPKKKKEKKKDPDDDDDDLDEEAKKKKEEEEKKKKEKEEKEEIIQLMEPRVIEIRVE